MYHPHLPLHLKIEAKQDVFPESTHTFHELFTGCAGVKRGVTDAFQAEVPALISKEFADQAPKIIEELFKIHMKNNIIQVHPTTSASTYTTTSADLQQQLYLKTKSNLQDQANDPEL
ncbi:hypothetical protein Tco_0439032 [Tanacetum coccineum]